MITENKIDISRVVDVEIDGIDYSDYPDFSDAFISYAVYDGKEMSEDELFEIQHQYPDWFYAKVERVIY